MKKIYNRTTAKPVKLKPIYDLPERSRQRWENMNVKRLMKKLLEVKRFDPETIAMHIKPEKDRLAYNNLKQHAMEENFCKIQNEISDIRAKLVPEQDADEEAERLKLIQQNVDNMVLAKMDGFDYDQIENELNAEVNFCSLNRRAQSRLENSFGVILQMNASKSVSITINWLSLLSQARKKRAESDRRLYEERRKAFLANNNTEPSDDMNERS